MTTKENGYNGWTNWETWNTNLWMTNDYDLYKEILYSLKHSGKFDSANAKYFCLEMFNNKLPDDIDAEKVDWQEIADSFNEFDEEGE